MHLHMYSSAEFPSVYPKDPIIPHLYQSPDSFLIGVLPCNNIIIYLLSCLNIQYYCPNGLY